VRPSWFPTFAKPPPYRINALLAHYPLRHKKPQRRKIKIMPDWAGALLLLAGYFVVMRWILPRFGVPT